MDQLGAPPNSASLYLQSRDAARPGVAPRSAMSQKTPLPPLKKPKSATTLAANSMDRSVHQSGGKLKDGGAKFKSIPASSLAGGFSVSPMPASGEVKFRPQTATNWAALPAAAKPAAPVRPEHNFAHQVLKHQGYSWSDIDPALASAAANLTVTQPSAINQEIVSVGYDKGETELSKKALETVKQAGQKLKEQPKISAELKAYAGSEEDAGRARRVSLSRALSVRNALIGMGVEGKRLGVKPVGIPTDGGPNDRVDVIIGR